MKQTNHKFSWRLRRLGILAIALIAAFSLSTQVRAQVTGTKTVAASGGDYTSIAAAITDLNTNGVGIGGAVINVPAGWTETAPSGGYKLGSTTLNASLSATKTLTFQKSGAGTNPLLTAFVGTIAGAGVSTAATGYSGIGEGIFSLSGTDYVTIDGIDLIDPSTNATATTQMEWGYGFFKLNSAAPFDGCQYNTIKNCTITMMGGVQSAGIVFQNFQVGGSTAFTPTAVTDANSYNRCYSNTIQKIGSGIYIKGYFNSSVLTYWDTNNDFGGSSVATGNTIKSFGPAATTNICNGIYSLNQLNLNASYNTLNNYNAGATINGSATVAPTAGSCYQIYNANQTATSGLLENATIKGNTITMTGGAGSTAMYGIYNYYKGGNMDISNNAFTWATTGTTTGTWYAMYAYYATVGATGYFKNNSLTGTFANSTGSCYGFYMYAQCQTNTEFSGNTLNNITRNAVTTGTTYLFAPYYSTNYNTVGTTTNIFNNVINNITLASTATSATLYATYYMGGNYNCNIYNNTISNITNAGTAASGTFYGFYDYYYGTNWNVYGNNLNTVNWGTSTGTIYGTYLYAYYGNIVNYYNNSTTGLTSSGSIYGFYDYYQYNAATSNYYNNTIADLTSNGATSIIYSWYKYVETGDIFIHHNTIKNIKNGAATAGASTIYGFYDYGYCPVNVGNMVLYDNIISVGNSSAGANASSNSSGGCYAYYSAGTSTAHPVKLYYNTLSVFGTSAQAAFGAHGIFNASTTYPAKLDVRNNLIMNYAANTNATPSSKMTCMRIGGAVGTYLNTEYDANSNNNNYFLANGSGSSTVYYYFYDGTTGYNTFAGMKGAIGARESASFSENTSFLSKTSSNANFFKPDPAVATQIESAAQQIGTALVAGGITTDYAGTVRQGNVGYLGSSPAGPDMGAYEGNYTALDLAAPIITHTAAGFTCNTGDRTITATIADYTGVDTTLAPTIYFKKNSGTWYSAAGTRTAGSYKSGTWSFVIGAAAMGGLVPNDVVSYYIVAQDLATPSANMGSLPVGAVMTNVNTVTTPPTTPYSYSIGNQLSGTYPVGAGQAANGGFNTLTAAAAAYNVNCLSGNIVFLLTDTLYNATTETFPVTFGVNPFASSSNTLTIKPASSNTVYFRSSTATGFIKLNGADYITIDGSNNGSTSRDLNFVNTSTAANAAIWLASLGGANSGATYNTVKNCNIWANAAQSSSTNIYGIVSSTTGAQTSAGENNDNNTFQNNNIRKVWIGISCLNSATNKSSNVVIKNNVIGAQSAPYTQSTSVAPYYAVTDFGVEVDNALNFNIQGNDIDGVFSTGTNYYPTGIRVGVNATGNIDGNKIHGMYINTGGWGAYGIHINGASAGVTIKNNMIYDIMTENYSSSSTTYNAFGIRLSVATTNTKIYNNSIYLAGTVSLNTSSAMSACLLSVTAQTGLEVKNNIFVNEMKSTVAGSQFYSVWWAVAPTFTSWDYNDYYGTTSASTPYGAYNVGYVNGVSTSTMTAFKAAMGAGVDANSLNLPVPFVSATDLHLNFGTTPTLFESGGQTLAAVTTDFDGQSRPGPAGSVNGGATASDIGADEFDGFPLPHCSTITPGTTVSSANPICSGWPFTLSLSGASNPTLIGGLNFQWMKSTNGGTTWSVIPGATNPTYNNPGITVATMYHCVIGCNYNPGVYDSSANVSVTLNTYVNCYCQSTHYTDYNYPASNYTVYGKILQVQLGTINYTNPATQFVAPYYTAVPNTVNTNIIAGQTYTLSVRCDYGYFGILAWIDWNANGVFDASEYYNLGSTSTGTTGSSQTLSMQIVAPVTIPTAAAKIRLRTNYYSYIGYAGPGDACTNGTSSSTAPFYYGETMDYFLNLIGLPATPANPTLSAVPVSCIAGTTIVPTGTPATGVDWYWQNSATDTFHTSANLVSGPLSIYANGTYYIRAYNSAFNIWSTGAGSITVNSFPAGPNAPTTPVAAANPACSSGTTVTVASAPAGETYYWQTSTGTFSQSNNASNPLTVTTNSTVVVRSLDNTSGCWSNPSSLNVTILPTITGASFNVTSSATCANVGDGTILVVPGSNPPLLPWYYNDFNAAFTNNASAQVFGTGTVSSGKLIMTQNAASQAGGGIQVFNPSALNANAFDINFDIVTLYGNGYADGISYSFGDDVVQIPSPATNGTNPENGSGTKLKLAFDEYANGSNAPGIYLMYNCNVLNQTSTTPGVLAYNASTSWTNSSSTTYKTTHIQITINTAGQVTVKVNGTPVFTNIQLPNGYLATNKSNWSHVFVSRTGAVYDEHSIDNFDVKYYDVNYYAYSVNSGSTWQTANNFNLNAGTYPVWITYNSNQACSVNLGNGTITAPIFNLTSTSDSMCTYYSMVPTLNLSPTFAADSFKWESSPLGTNTWSVITGARSGSYTPATYTSSLDYRLSLNCGTGVASTTKYQTGVKSTYAVTPTITSTSQTVTPCGIGTATLNATASSGATPQWLQTSSMSVPLALGGTYTTPTLSSTTNYYVSASQGGTMFNLGLANYVVNSTNSGFSDIGLMFDATVPFLLQSVAVYPINTTAGPATITVAVKNAAGTVLQSTTLNITSCLSSSPVKTVLPLNFNVPAGTGNRLVVTAVTGLTGLIREVTTGYTYPYTIPGIASITSAYTSGASTSYYYYFYDWKLSTGCASTPQAVPAVVITAPSITASVTPATDTVCAGGSSSLNVTSSNSNYTYTWTPGSLSGAAQTVTPTPTTTVQTKNYYRVNAIDAGTGCKNKDSVLVVVNPNPSAVTVTPVSPHMLVGSPAQLTATGGTNGSTGLAIIGTGTTQNSSSVYPSPYGLYYGSSHEQYIITAAELTAAGIPAGQITSLAFNLASVANTTYNYQYFNIQMGNTSTANFSTAALVTTGLTQVYTNTAGFMLTGSGWKTYTFTTPFTWNGTSNVVVDVSFSNCSVCNGTSSCTTSFSSNDIVNQSATAFVSTINFHADNNCTINSMAPSITGTTYSQRPNIRFGYNSFNSNPFYWTPAQSLYMNATASTPYNAGGAANTLYANPRLDSVYTITARNLTTGCTTTTSDSVFVEQYPANYDCSHSTALTITPTCNSIPGTSKYGWYNPASIPTTPATPTTATCGNADDDVWYSFTRPAGMNAVTLRVQGSSNYDVAFEIVSGACGGTQTVVACVNNSNGTNNAIETYQLNVPSGTPTNTYYVRVYDARLGYGSGNFDICVYGIVPPPVNNNPCGANNFSNNTAMWGGNANILSSYDGGAPMFMGIANNATSNPPTGINCVYYTGSTAYANNLGANEPTPPCGNLGSNAHTVWFKFKAPTIGGVDVTLRSLFNGNPTNFSNILAAYAASVDPCTGTPTYTNLACATTGVLSMTAASTILAPYAGQDIYVQLAGNGASSPVGNYMLSIQAIPQNIALSNPATSSLTVTLPTAPGATNVTVQWRVVGSTGYSLVNVSPSVGTYTISGLNSGVNYQVWAKYSNATQAFYTNFATLGTTIGCSAAPVAPTVIPVANHCSRDTISWPAHPLASTSFPYRLYWKQSTSTGYSVLAVPASAYNATTGKVSVLITNLAVNTTYQFYYRVMCAGGAQVVSNVNTYTQCNGPAKIDGTFHGAFEHNGRYFVDAEFTDVTSFTDNTPVDGNVHEVVLNEVSDMNAVLNGSGVKVATNGEENGAFELIPNPTSDNVFVEYNLANAGRVVIRVMNIQGKVVKEEVLDNSNASGAVQIDLSDVQSGVYMVSVDAPGYKATKRLVVTK